MPGANEVLGCPRKYFLFIPQNFSRPFLSVVKFQDNSLPGCPSRRACFKKNSSLHIWPKIFRTTCFRNFTPKSTILSVENSDDLFLVHLFLQFPSLAHLTDCPPLLLLNPKFSPHKSLNDLF